MINSIKGKNQEHAYTFELPLGILNVVVWAALCWSTCSFVSMINKRFGRDFQNAKCKLFTVLFLFSMSFLIRATWDFYIKAHPDMKVENDVVWAIIIFMLYFTTEWLPMSVVYLVHFFDFYRNLKNERTPPRDLRASQLEKQ